MVFVPPVAPKPAPVYSQIEFVERVNQLPASIRLRYQVLTRLALLVAFLAAALATLLLIALLNSLSGNPPAHLGDWLWLIFPALGALLICVGFTPDAIPQSVLPNTTLTQVARHAARVGLVNGLMIGIGFGGVWMTINRLYLFVALTTQIVLDINPVIVEIIVYSVLFGVLLAPLYAAFRAFSSVIGMWILHRLQASRG
ncbi:MAG: hypothetical protein H7Y11_08920 [Armatimonadetes bacterium]|nr:hypothetical protein [Anaerolineae bacterium]